MSEDEYRNEGSFMKAMEYITLLQKNDLLSIAVDSFPMFKQSGQHPSKALFNVFCSMFGKNYR